MGDVATPRDSANADVTLFWRIRHQNGQCQSGSGALWFVSFFIFTIAWSYILGASDVRRYIGRRANPFTAAWDVRLNVALSVSGSLVLQLAMMVATAQMLRDPSHMDPSSPAVPLSYPLAAWLIRPLPATVVLLTSLISPTTYTKNGLELQFIEVLYGLPCLAIYSSLESRAATASTNLQLLVSPTAPIDGVIPTPQAKSTTSSFVTFSVTSRFAASATSLPVAGLSPDRTCGAAKRYSCMGSTWGNCCSRFGFCGADDGYCGAGCQEQFGDCYHPRGHIANNTLSPDGTCGGALGYSCQGTRWGNCCSEHGYCGVSDNHCGFGCQSAFGNCSAAPARALSQLRAGALLGLITGALSLFAFSVCFIHFFMRVWPAHRRRRYIWIIGVISIVSNLCRLIAGFLLWNAALRLDPEAFCPDGKTTASITALWAFVPAADHLWRALF